MNAIRLGVSWRALEPTRGVLDAGYAARVRRLVRLAGAEGLWVLIDMHQDLWSERFGGNGAPDWATLDDGQPVRRRRRSPTPTCSRRSGGRSRASGANRDGIRSEYVRAYAGAGASCSRTRTRSIGYDAMNEPACELTRGAVRPAAPARGGDAVPRAVLPRARAGAARRRPRHADLLRGLADDRLRLPVRRPPAAIATWASATTSTAASRSAPDPCPQQETEALRNGARQRGRQPRRRAGDRVRRHRQARGPRAASSTAPTPSGVGWLYWQYKTYGDPTTSAASEGPDAESIVTPGGRRQGGQGARAGAPVPDAHRRAPRAVALQRRRRALHPALDGGARRRHRRRAAAARPIRTASTVRAHGVRVVRRSPLTLRGSGRASITVTRR